jgi:hypothetical protein
MGSDVFLSAMVAKFDRFCFRCGLYSEVVGEVLFRRPIFLVTTLFGGKPAGVGCRFGLMAVRL